MDIIFYPNSLKPIGNFRGPRRVRIFVWLAAHDKLLTNDNRARRHLTVDSACSECGHPVEDMDHILRKCHPAIGLWSQRVKMDEMQEFLEINLCERIRSNITNLTWFAVTTEHWDILFRLSCWCLWCRRSNRVFNMGLSDWESV